MSKSWSFDKMKESGLNENTIPLHSIVVKILIFRYTDLSAFLVVAVVGYSGWDAGGAEVEY